MTNDLQEIAKDFLTEAQEDYVGLWSLVWDIKNDFPELDRNESRASVLNIIRELLHENLIKAGIPKISGDFEEWTGSVEEIVSRIRNEWEELGTDPTIGDIVWFVSTE